MDQTPYIPPAPNLSQPQAPQVSQPSQTPQASLPPVSPISDQPTPKKKTGKIIAIILLILLLLGGGGVAAYFLLILPNDPSYIASQMITNLAKSINSGITTSGSITITTTNEETAKYLESAVITLGAQRAAGSSSTDVSIQFNTTELYQEQQATLGLPDLSALSFKIGEIYNAEDGVFVKVTGLKDAFSQMLLMAIQYTAFNLSTVKNHNECDIAENEPMDCIQQPETYLAMPDLPDLPISSFLTSLSDIITELDGQWLGFTFEDIDTITGGSTNSKCLADALSRGLNGIDQLYDKNQFLSLNLYKGTDIHPAITETIAPNFYQISLNAEKAWGFSTDLTAQLNAQDFNSCTIDNSALYPSFSLPSAPKELSLDAPSQEDIQELIDSLPTLYVSKDNSYNLSHLYFSIPASEDTPLTITADLNFTYPENLKIESPETYTPIFTAVERIVQSIQEAQTSDYLYGF